MFGELFLKLITTNPRVIIKVDHLLTGDFTVTIPLIRNNLIKPMQLSVDGKMREMTMEELQNMSHNPVIPAEELSSDEEVE